MEHEGSTFLSGCASRAGFFYFAKEADELAIEDEPNTSFFRYREADTAAQFRMFDESVGWTAISMALVDTPPGRVVIAVSPRGEYWELESVSTKQDVGRIAKFTGNLRRLAAVDRKFYACGMDRVVLKRTKTGSWKSIGPGPQTNDPQVVGFEDIGGYSTNELYAVGWGGEIWWYDRQTWRRAESPTTTTLTSLTCAPDGIVYAVGHDGVLVKGRHDTWERVETGRSEDLKDVAHLDTQIYACTDHALYKLQTPGLIEETNFDQPHDRPTTCLHLLESPGELVSLGTKDVFIKQDAAWHRLV
jgi:hypothetical protein